VTKLNQADPLQQQPTHTGLILVYGRRDGKTPGIMVTRRVDGGIISPPRRPKTTLWAIANTS